MLVQLEHKDPLTATAGSVMSSLFDSDLDHLFLVLARRHHYYANEPSLALRTEAERRVLMLREYVADSATRSEQSGILRATRQLEEVDLDAIAIIDATVQYPSDENILASLKTISSCELRYILGPMSDMDCPPISQFETARNPRQDDSLLASLGFWEGNRHAESMLDACSQFAPSAWVRRLQVAGSEYSVSLCHYYSHE